MACVLVEARHLPAIRAAVDAELAAVVSAFTSTTSRRVASASCCQRSPRLPIAAFVVVCSPAARRHRVRCPRTPAWPRSSSEVQSADASLVWSSRAGTTTRGRSVISCVFGSPSRALCFEHRTAERGADALGRRRDRLGARCRGELAGARSSRSSATSSNFARNAQNPVPLPSGRQPGPLPRALARGIISMRPTVCDRKPLTRRTRFPNHMAGNRVHFHGCWPEALPACVGRRAIRKRVLTSISTLLQSAPLSSSASLPLQVNGAECVDQPAHHSSMVSRTGGSSNLGRTCAAQARSADRVVQRCRHRPTSIRRVVGVDLQQQPPVALGVPNVSPLGCAPHCC